MIQQEDYYKLELQIKSKVFRLKSKNKTEEIHDLIGDALTEMIAVQPSENWKNCCLNIIEQYADAVDDIDPTIYSELIRFNHVRWEVDGPFEEETGSL